MILRIGVNLTLLLVAILSASRHVQRTRKPSLLIKSPLSFSFIVLQAGNDYVDQFLKSPIESDVLQRFSFVNNDSALRANVRLPQVFHNAGFAERTHTRCDSSSIYEVSLAEEACDVLIQTGQWHSSVIHLQLVSISLSGNRETLLVKY